MWGLSFFKGEGICIVLIQLLDYLQNGETHSVQDLAELMQKDMDTVRTELEYLEHQGYIRKVSYRDGCKNNCKSCHVCDQAAPNCYMWEVVKRTGQGGKR